MPTKFIVLGGVGLFFGRGGGGSANFIFMAAWIVLIFDPRASGRKGQECPREIRTEEFMFMFTILAAI